MKDILPGAALEPFDEVEVFGGVFVLLQYGEEHRIEILGVDDSSIMHSIEDNKLTVFGGATHSITDQGMTVRKKGKSESALVVTLPSIKTVRIREITQVMFLSYPVMDLEIIAMGKATVAGSLTARKLLINMTGSIENILEGECHELRLTLSGDSAFDGTHFNSVSAYVTSDDRSLAIMNVKESLIIDARGSSTIEYNSNVPRLTLVAAQSAFIKPK